MCCNPLRMGMISSRHDVLSRTSRTGGQSNRRWGSKAIRIGHSLEDSSLRTRKTALSAEILLGSPKTSRSISERNSRKIRLRCIFRRTLDIDSSCVPVSAPSGSSQHACNPTQPHQNTAGGRRFVTLNWILKVEPVCHVVLDYPVLSCNLQHSKQHDDCLSPIQVLEFSYEVRSLLPASTRSYCNDC